MGYGKIIEKIRNGKSYVAFSKEVGISKSHLERMEKEHSNKGKERLEPPIDKLKQICDRTGYPFRQFLEEAGYIERGASTDEDVAAMLKEAISAEELKNITSEQLIAALAAFRNALKDGDK